MSQRIERIERNKKAGLRLQLLGRFEAWRDGASIPPAEWRGQKARDLLKILALARGRFVSKDQLCDWLWPGADLEAAEANLRSAVSDLRRLLEPDLARGRDSAFVLTRREGYAFNLAAPVSLDVIEFEQALTAATRAELETALARYGGDLLEEDPYAEWALPERERLRGLRLEALAHLTELCLEEFDCPAAIRFCEQALALDAGRETSWRALMRAYALSGDRAAALRAFDRCRAALARDLGVEPLPETSALHEQILRGELAALPTITQPAAPPHAQPDAHAKSLTEPRWLYRLGALSLLLHALVSGLSLSLQLTGALQGAFVSTGDAGAEALPFLLDHPEVLARFNRQLFLFIPVGLLLLPGYLAWFTALRSNAPRPARPVSAWAWLGVGLGVIDVTAYLINNAVGVTQLTVLPSAFIRSAPDQRPLLITLWDVLRQLASVFGVISATANPLAVGLLCWASRSQPGFPSLLVWPGLGLALLTLLSLAAPGATLASGWLIVGLGLVVANFLWWLGLAAILWRL